MWHMKGSEPPEPLLHLILVKYYLSFQWTQTCHFFEKCATIWLIAVSNELPIQILTALYHIPYWWEIHVLYHTCNSHSPSKNVVYDIMDCASWTVAGAEVALSRENCFFSLICCGCVMGALFKGCVGASPRSDQATRVTPFWRQTVWY